MSIMAITRRQSTQPAGAGEGDVWDDEDEEEEAREEQDAFVCRSRMERRAAAEDRCGQRCDAEREWARLVFAMDSVRLALSSALSGF
jgi:hypothetical protein